MVIVEALSPLRPPGVGFRVKGFRVFGLGLRELQGRAQDLSKAKRPDRLAAQGPSACPAKV